MTKIVLPLYICLEPHCDNYYGKHKVSTDLDLPRLCVSVTRVHMCGVYVYACVCMCMHVYACGICASACVYLVSDRSHQGNSFA